MFFPPTGSLWHRWCLSVTITPRRNLMGSMRAAVRREKLLRQHINWHKKMYLSQKKWSGHFVVVDKPVSILQTIFFGVNKRYKKLWYPNGILNSYTCEIRLPNFNILQYIECICTVCVGVCVYIYVCVCGWVCVCVHIYTYIYICKLQYITVR